MNVPRLMVLRAIRDAGGILAAADELRISSSAVSQQLTKLERETGLALAVRTSNAPVRLTTAGRRLAERADAIAAELRATYRDITQLADAQQRTVVVGGFPSVVQSMIIPAATQLRDSESPIDVRIVETRDEDPALYAALRAGSLDLAIVKHETSLDAGHDITQTVLHDDPYRILIPASWPRPSSLTELLDRPWVGHPAGTPGRAAIDRVQTLEGTTLRIEHECTEYPIAIAITAAGLAASIVPRLALASTPTTGTHTLDVGDLGYRRIAALHLLGKDEVVAVAAVLDHLKRSPPSSIRNGDTPSDR